MSIDIDKFVIPLHDKKWVVSQIKKCLLDELKIDYEDMDEEEFNEGRDELLEEFDSWSIDGSIILGKPTTKSDGYSSLMLGLVSEEYLDDQSLLEYITQVYWKDLAKDSFIDLRLMESFIGVMDIKKDDEKAISEIIARSLYTEIAPDVKTTADCKKVLAELYGSDNMKRISKHKWFNIEYRLFHNEDEEEFSIVSYKGKLISHYKLAYVEE